MNWEKIDDVATETLTAMGFSHHYRIAPI